MRLAFTPDVERELEAIVDDLLELSSSAADRFADAFDRTTARLVAFPLSGPAIDDQFRLALVGTTGYVLGYQVADDMVLITSVRHGSQRR